MKNESFLWHLIVVIIFMFNVIDSFMIRMVSQCLFIFNLIQNLNISKMPEWVIPKLLKFVNDENIFNINESYHSIEKRFLYKKNHIFISNRLIIMKKARFVVYHEDLVFLDVNGRIFKVNSTKCDASCREFFSLSNHMTH
jgi:hypothetical protein